MRQFTEEQKKRKAFMDKESRARRRALSSLAKPEIEKIKEKAEASLASVPPDSHIAPALRAAIVMKRDTEIVKAVEDWQVAIGSQDNVHKSLATLEYLRDNALSENVRFRASKDLLDRAAIDLRKQPSGKTIVNLFSDASTEELMAMLRGLPPTARPAEAAG